MSQLWLTLLDDATLPVQVHVQSAQAGNKNRANITFRGAAPRKSECHCRNSSNGQAELSNNFQRIF